MMQQHPSTHNKQGVEYVAGFTHTWQMYDVQYM